MSLSDRQDAMRRRFEIEKVRREGDNNTIPPETIYGHSSGIAAHENRVRSQAPRGATDVESVAQPRRVLDLKAAGTYLGLSYWTVRDLVFAGAIPTLKIPCPKSNDGRTIRRILIDRRDLDAFIERNKNIDD
jgi:hypothetical protein